MPRIRNADRLTPNTDAWLADLRAYFDSTPGAQSELARQVSGSDDVRQIRNWVSLFSRWFHRKSLPDLEHYFAVENARQFLTHGRKKRRGQRLSRC